jgi:hypothetical protein
VGDLVVSVEFEEVDRVQRRCAVIADEKFRHDEVAPPVHAPNLESDIGWVLSAPFAEVLDAFKALTSLGELKDGALGIDLMCDVFILA